MSARHTPLASRPRASSAALQGGTAAASAVTHVVNRSTTAGLKPGATRYVARRARAADADAVHALIAHYAAQGLLLPRSEDDVLAHIDHFLVLSLAGRAVGCVALEPYGAHLAEIRSLAMAPAHAGNGRGARLVRFALAIARRRKIARVFAVTHAPEFFQRLGFAPADRRAITEKVERDCRGCPKQVSCALTALIFTIVPRREILPVLTCRPITAPA